jgi:BirA family biotin operon repressor/biotin-[acetyl-CoA-carboxylase] ligase
VRQFTGLSPWIKWPNDVLLRGRKVAGILIEHKSRTIAGIGLNVNQSAEQFAAAGLLDAGSLASITRQTHDRDAIAKQLILNLDTEYDALLRDAEALESRWVTFVGLLDQRVVMEHLDGTLNHGRLGKLTFDQVLLEMAIEDGPSMFGLPQIERRSMISIRPEAVRHLSFDL